MKKFAANYLISETGTFLKNGLVLLTDDGEVLEIVDTKGNLEEIAQLTFLNGILIPNFRLVKVLPQSKQLSDEFSVRSSIIRLADGLTEISLIRWIEFGVQIHEQFPGLAIPEIFEKLDAVLLTDCGFSKQNISGLFLLKGTDLVNLHFTSGYRLKMIL